MSIPMSDDCCIFAMLDWYNSDASGLFGASSATPRGHFVLNPISADYSYILDGDATDPIGHASGKTRSVQ